MTVEIKCHSFKTNPSENEVHFLLFLRMRLVLCRSLLNIESIILSKSLREISFENVQSVREVEILRHRIHIICCSC